MNEPHDYEQSNGIYDEASREEEAEGGKDHVEKPEYIYTSFPVIKHLNEMAI